MTTDHSVPESLLIIEKGLHDLNEQLYDLMETAYMIRMGPGAILSIKDAARYLTLSVATFRREVRIPRVRLSEGRVGYIRTDLERWIADRKEFPANEEEDAEIEARAMDAARKAAGK